MNAPATPQRSANELAEDRTRWAADRTLWAADRTFIAWLRTSISMIGFGVSIGKAGDILGGSEHLDARGGDTLVIVGTALVSLAVLGLLGALIQEIRISNRLARMGYPRIEPTPLGRTMGILVLMVGIFGGVAIFL